MPNPNTMPARIWAGGGTYSQPRFWSQHTPTGSGGMNAVAYHRADIVEKLVEAAGETLAKFDACSDSTVRNTPLGLTKVRNAAAALRALAEVEDSNADER